MAKTKPQKPGSLERVVGPFARGQALWAYVNGQPALRYYVRPHNYGHVLGFNASLSNAVYYDNTTFWATEAGVLNWMVEGLECRLTHDLAELVVLRTRLSQCWPND